MTYYVYIVIVVIVSGLFIVCRRPDHPCMLLTVSVCLYSLLRSVLPRSPQSVALAAVYRRVARWSHCLAVVSPSPSPLQKPPDDCTPNDVLVLMSSQQASVIAAKTSRWQRLGRILWAPWSLTAYHNDRPHRLKPAWRSAIWLMTFSQLYKVFGVDIPV